MARKFRNPSIPHPTENNLVVVVSALKEAVEIGQRLRGKDIDSFVRLEEFQEYTNSNTTQTVEAHVGRTDNPHEVTASQVGADAEGSAQAVENSLNTHIADTLHVPNTATLNDVPSWDGAEWIASSRLTELESIVDILASALGIVFVEYNGETVTHNGEVVYYIET